ncbi:trace amine-associated receptor 13c-like [Polypterus senegalus]|uniref:trace amine-associated receptor 13c-like n=1 Tax=Polypterus senegalus TaxID=55291 RepID=UPI001965E921|nr:trace amine-associated receptor 13c-like [Polypterus senegalus]
MLTVLGNLAVIFTISHFKHLHTPTNMLLISLAFADFLVGSIIMPFYLPSSIDACWYFGDVVCFIFVISALVAFAVSVTNIVFIAFDHYFAVCYPLLYSTKITFRVTLSSVAFSWLLSLLYAFLMFYMNGNFNGLDTLRKCLGECLVIFNETLKVVDMACMFVIPCSIVMLLHGKIFMIARRHVKIINAMANQIHSKCNNKGGIPKKSEKKAATTLGIVVLVYIFCWVPYYTSIIINEYLVITVPSSVSVSLTWLIYLNSCMNPIIYALYYPWFQNSLKQMLNLKIRF